MRLIRRQSGFVLTSSTLLLTMAMLSVAMVLALNHRETTMINTNANLLDTQLKQLTKALERYYISTCNTGNVSQAVLSGQYLPGIVSHPFANDYSLNIVTQSDSVNAVVSVTIIRNVGKISSVAITSGAAKSGSTITLTTPIFRARNYHGHRRLYDWSMYGKITCN